MKQMHPRNIYNARLDFNHLANSYLDFKKHLKLDVNGKVTMDFKDPEALRALAKVLLKKDFNLDIEIPINTLIPTIPLRLNYILFIEDLLNCANIHSDVIGIDIGTGASCIYPLLAVRQNKWKMVATDCNAVNLKYATNNVVRNKLEEQIKVIEVSGQTTLKELLDKDNLDYTFCMCNPPFFGGVHELSSQLKSRKPDRRKPNNAFSASAHEVITQGGEVEFVTKIITESCDYKNRIKIFTTMLGIKASLKPILDMLKSSKYIKSHIQTTFFQGHTSRWGVAWTYQNNIDLKNFSEPDGQKHVKKKKPFVHSHPYIGTVENIGIQIEEIFEKLQMQYKVLKKQSASRLYNIVAHFNTWSNSRQKRREAKRMAQIMEGLTSTITTESNNGNSSKQNCIDISMETSLEDVANESTTNNTTKRRLSESDEDVENEEIVDSKRTHVKNSYNSNTQKLVEASVYVHIENSVLTIEMDALSENTDRDSLHQILQYIKNNLKLL